MCLQKLYFHIIMFFTITLIYCEPPRLLRSMSSTFPREAKSTIDAVLLACPRKQAKRNCTATAEKECQDQLMINIKVDPSFHVEKCEKYLVLDEAYEPHSRTKAKLLSPYLIEISRGEPVMLYPLEFSKSMKCDSDSENAKKTAASTANCATTPKCPVTTKKPATCKEYVKPKPKCARPTPKPVSPCKQHAKEKEKCATTTKKPCGGACKANQEFRFPMPKSSKNAKKPCQSADFLPISDLDSSEYNKRTYSNLKSNNNPLTSVNDLLDNTNFNHDMALKLKLESPTMLNNAEYKFERNMDSRETLANDNPVQFELIGKNNKDYEELDSSRTTNFGIVDALNGIDLSLKPDIEEKEVLDNENKANLGLDSSLINGIEVLENIGRETENIDSYNKDKADASDINFSSKIAAIEPVVDNLMEKRRLPIDESQIYEAEENSSDDFYADMAEKQQSANDEENENDIRNMEVKKFPLRSFHAETRHCKQKKPGKYVFQGIQLANDKHADSLKNSKTFKQNDKIEGSESIQQNTLDTNHHEYQPPLIDLTYPLEELLEENLKQKTHARRKRSNSNAENRREMFQGLINAKQARGPFNTKNILDSLPQAPEYTQDTKKYVDFAAESSLNNVYNKANRLNFENHNLKDPLSAEALNKYYYDSSAYSSNFNYVPNEFYTNKAMENDENYEQAAATMDPLDNFNLVYNQRKLEFMPSSILSEMNNDQPKTVEVPSVINTYDAVLSDPNLEFKDKVNAVDAINPLSKDLNEKYSVMSKQLETSMPIPFEPFKSNELKAENAKWKRSFLIYDDLEAKDTLDDNDYIFNKFDTGFLNTRAVEDMPACDSCGGKKKKPPIPCAKVSDAKCQMQADLPKESQSLLEAPNVPDGEGQLCTTCGGKNKKTDNKPGLHEEEVSGCQCRTLNTPCYCKSKKSVRNTCYTVYKMNAPLPFLTTRVRIFRKCRNTWWKIAPSVTLNSLSTVYVNKNLSVMFSSRVDIFQFEKSLRLQNHALLVPNRQHIQRTNSKLNGENYEDLIKAIDLEQLNAHPEEMVQLDNGNKRSVSYDEHNICEALQKVKKRDEHVKSWDNLFLKDFNQAMDKFQFISDNNVHSISDLGYVPSHTKVLSRCPQESRRLCFSVLEDKSPAYNIKIRMPFTQNALIFPNAIKVKISRIITDATTNNVLRVSVDLINEGFIAKQFDVSLSQCPSAMSVKANDVKYSKKTFLSPHIAETVTFMLPLVVQVKQFCCTVVVKTSTCHAKRISEKKEISFHTVNNPTNTGNSNNQYTVATREMTVEPNSRCFCIWKCRCHCVKKIETNVDFEVCKIMDNEELSRAGLLSEGDLNRKPTPISTTFTFNDYIDKLKQFSLYAVLVLVITFLMGLFKAIMGLCCERINRFGFKCVQLGKSYENSCKTRRFFINVLFFILLPFLCCCPCCAPAEQDLLLSKTSWRCKGGGNTMYFPCPDQTDDEEEIILQKLNSNKNKQQKRSSGGSMRSSNYDINLRGFDEILEEDEDDDEANTRYVLKALAESRLTLKTMLSHHSSQKFCENEENITNEKYQKADEFVQSLKKAQIVYRIFNTPQLGLINIPPGKKYCIRGYFLPSLGAAYEFINYCPLAQYICFSPDGTSLAKVHPPNYLSPDIFSKTYKNKIEVLEANELATQEPDGIPCVNVLPFTTLSESISKLVSSESEEDLNKIETIIEPVVLSDTDESINFSDQRFLSPRASHRLFDIVECIEELSDNEAQ